LATRPIFKRLPYNLTSEKLEEWDLSNLDVPYKIEDTITITNAGRTMTNGAQDFISNADFMLDGSTLYMVADTHPFEGNALSFVADMSTISTIVIDPANITMSINNCTWQTYSTVSRESTGFDKNHNCGFISNSYGAKILTVSKFCTLKHGIL